MLNILLVGCNGKMGRVITELCRQNEQFRIVAGVDLFSENTAAFPVFTTIEECREKPDVIVDFSRPSSLMSTLKFAVSYNVPAVIATTGHSPEQRELLKKAAASVPVFFSANMSLGVAVVSHLVKRCAAVLGDDYDIEVIERHHNQKVDAPSGTALMLADAAASSLSQQPVYTYERHSLHQARSKHEIGISSIRGGTIVGDHEVLFAGVDETISLHQNAQSRNVFAAGALRAACFVADKPAGMYNMDQLVEETLTNF